MDNPQNLRAKAAKSRRIAATMTDKLTVDLLVQLAVELEEQADADEVKSRGGDQY
jgi:hypothetical protein